MAEETKSPSGEETKIRLNPAKTGSGDTDKIKLSQPGQMPPKIQLRSAESKKSTTRIDLASVKPPVAAAADDIKALSPEKQAEFFKKSTIRIEQSGAPAAAPVETKRSTVRVDQAGGATSETQKVPGETSPIVDPRRSTIRVDQSGQPQGDTARIDVKKTTLRVDQPAGATQAVSGETSKIDAKRSTIRIDGKETQKVQGETARVDVKKSTIRIEAIPQTGSGETQRTGGETRRIDLKTVETGQMAPAPGATAPVAPVAPKMTDTQQQKLKKETTRLEIPPEVIKRQTGKIQTGPVAEPPDVFKKRTGKLATAPVPTPPVVPVAPAEVPAIPAASAADTVARPKTILVRRPQRPGAESPKPVAVTQVLTEATAQARKSETARLEIPKDAGAEERPTTRPKTIRIKRPDGTTARKALTISRPTEGEESVLPEGLRAPAAVEQVGSEDPGGIWAVLALAAMLVVGALIYVLLAQTLAPELPFPGKII